MQQCLGYLKLRGMSKGEDSDEKHYKRHKRTADALSYLPEQIDLIRERHTMYRVARRYLEMYFTVRPETRDKADGLAVWYAYQWAPWCHDERGTTSEWLKTRRLIDKDIEQVFGPGVTLKKAYDDYKAQGHDHTVHEGRGRADDSRGTGSGVRSRRASDRPDGTQGREHTTRRDTYTAMRQRVEADEGSSRERGRDRVQQGRGTGNSEDPPRAVDQFPSKRLRDGEGRRSLKGVNIIIK